MMQIIEQTYEEKVAMYMKQPKKKLAEMLIECNKHLDKHIQPPERITISSIVYEINKEL